MKNAEWVIDLKRKVKEFVIVAIMLAVLLTVLLIASCPRVGGACYYKVYDWDGDGIEECDITYCWDGSGFDCFWNHWGECTP